MIEKRHVYANTLLYKKGELGDISLVGSVQIPPPALKMTHTTRAHALKIRVR